MGKKQRMVRQSTMANEDHSYAAMVNELKSVLEERNATIIEYQQQIKDKEIECLRKEISILQNLASDSANRPNFSFADIESALPAFSGEGHYPVSKWVGDFENIAVLFGLSDVQKLIYGHRLIKGSAKASLSAASKINSWSEFKEHLINEFKTSVNSADVHLKLMDRKKKHSESYLDYFYSVYELGKQGNLEDCAIITYAIKGIQDSEFNKAILYGAMNVNEFKEKLKIYSSIRDKCKSGADQRFHSRLPITRQREISQNSSNKTVFCFSCGGKGHYSRECFKKSQGPKCFKCDEYGHKATQCLKKPDKQIDTKDVALVGELRCDDVYLNKDVKINNVKIKSFLDTGSDLSFIREDCFKRLNIHKILKMPITFRGVGSKELKTLGSFHTSVNIDGNDFDEVFHIVSQNILPKECVLGKTLLKQASVTISPDEFTIMPINVEEKNPLMCLQISHKPEIDLSHVSDKNIAQAVRDLINDYKTSKGKCSPIEMRILLRNEEPIWQSPRRLAPVEKEFVNQQMDEWLREGIIRESSSDFASPIVIVSKKDGTKRICVDYRAINKVIIKDKYPLPLIDDHIDRLQSSKVFTTLDLRNGFFHVSISSESRKYTAFVTPNGHYEFLRVPFGLCNSPAVFQRFINKVFDPLIRQGKVLAYVDDLVIPAKDETEAYHLLEEVLEVASTYGLQIKWTKCQFLMKGIKYLGYEIQDGCIRPSNEKTEAVKKFPEPRTIKQLQSFLGLTGYFRRFIANYSLIAKPLTDLLRKEEEYHFGPTQKSAFESLQKQLCEKPVLNIYRENAPTELHTDASKFGCGAVLVQKSAEDNEFHPVHFFSKKTSKCEENYTSYELEVLAIINALKKLRVYLIGIKFTIVTDCSAFKNTMSRKELCPRIARWALMLEDFNYEIEHRAGRSMRHVDALSRIPYVMMIADTLLQRVMAAQKTDSTVKMIMEILKHTQYEDYFLEGGLLFKYLDGRKLFYVPKSMQSEIIRSAHEQGHFGYKKVEQIICQEFFIPKMKEKIQTYIKNCVKCILAAKEGKKEGFLYPIPKENIPLQTYHIDHLGPMTATNKKYKYILSVVDGFSKFTWLYPTQTTKTDEVIKKLKQQQTIFGNPRRIIVDRGTAFTSKTFQQYCKEEGIECVHITTGVPRGNGQVERMHKVVIAVLTKLSDVNPSDWYKHIAKVQRFINSTYSRSTGYSPFEILVGTKMRNKEDTKLAETIYQAIIDTFDGNRNEVRANVAEQILKIQQENCKSFNKKRRDARRYNLGDVVAIKRTQFGTGLKISPKYLGPYKITAIKKNDRYDVHKIGYHDGPINTSTSVDQMKPFMILEDESDTDDETQYNEDTEDPEDKYTQ